MKFLSTLLFALTLLISAPSESAAQSYNTEWLLGDQYQAHYDYNVHDNQGYAPTYVEARVFHGRVYYYAVFDTIWNLQWSTSHGISDYEYQQEQIQNQREGYYLVHHQRLVYQGRAHNQSVWHRR